MKRLLCLILCLFAATACGSDNGDDAATVASCSFSSKAEVIWQNKSYQGEIIREGANSLMITLSGENFAVPIRYDISQGGYRSTQGELEMAISFEDAQPQSVAVEIYNALSMLGGSETTREENITVYKTPLAVLKYDSDNDTFVSLETANGKVIFKDFSFTEKEY